MIFFSNLSIHSVIFVFFVIMFLIVKFLVIVFEIFEVVVALFVFLTNVRYLDRMMK